MTDLYDRLKSVSAGYASFDYAEDGFQVFIMSYCLIEMVHNVLILLPRTL